MNGMLEMGTHYFSGALDQDTFSTWWCDRIVDLFLQCHDGCCDDDSSGKLDFRCSPGKLLLHNL